THLGSGRGGAPRIHHREAAHVERLVYPALLAVRVPVVLARAAGEARGEPPPPLDTGVTEGRVLPRLGGRHGTRPRNQPRPSARGLPEHLPHPRRQLL